MSFSPLSVRFSGGGRVGRRCLTGAKHNANDLPALGEILDDSTLGFCKSDMYPKFNHFGSTIQPFGRNLWFDKNMKSGVATIPFPH